MKLKRYEIINRKLAKEELTHLPLEMSGNDKKIKMSFKTWDAFYKVRYALHSSKIVSKGLEFSGHARWNKKYGFVIELIMEEV